MPAPISHWFRLNIRLRDKSAQCFLIIFLLSSLLCSCKKSKQDSSLGTQRTEASPNLFQKEKAIAPQEIVIKKRKPIPKKWPTERKINHLKKSFQKMSLAELEDLALNPMESEKSLMAEFRVMFALFQRIGELDHQRGLALVEKLDLSSQRTAIIGIYESWGKKNYDDAIQSVLAIPDTSRKKQALSACLKGLSKVDPEKAYHMTIESQLGQPNPYDIEHYSALYTIFNAWAEKDLLTSFQNTANLKSYNKSRIRKEMLRRAIKNQPKGITDFYHSLTDDKERLATLKIILNTGDTKKFDRNAFLQSLTSPAEIELAEQGFVQMKITKKTTPAQRAKIIERLPQAGYMDKLNLMLKLTKHDLDTAKQFLSEIDSYSQKREMTGFMLHAYAQKSPDEALQYTLDSLDDNVIRNSLNLIGAVLTKNDAAKAISDVMAHGDSDQHGYYIQTLYSRWALVDIDAATDHLSRFDHEHPRITKIYGEIGEGYAYNPTKGVEWIDSIPKEENQAAATKELVKGWIKKDPDGSLDWVNSFEHSHQRDLAVEQIARSLVSKSPKIAMEWASSIADEERFTSSLQNTYQRWANADREAAQSWLVETELINESEKQKLQQNLNR